MMLFVAAFAIAIVLTMMAIPPLMMVAHRFHFLDTPDYRKVHKTTVPRIGGVAMVCISIVLMSLLVLEKQNYAMFVLGYLVLFVFGVLDDIRNLDYKYKLLGQVLAGLLVFQSGFVRIETLPLITGQLDPPSSLLVTLLFMVAVTNAVNFVDGLDGLAGGTSLLTFSLIGVLAAQIGHFDILFMALIFSGTILGFLRFNTHPASIFMGDTGSQFLGFSMACLALMLTQQDAGLFSPALVLLLLGLPIFDIVSVVCQRLLAGQSPFKPDKRHIHHKLLELTGSHLHAVAIIYVLQILLLQLCYYYRFAGDSKLLLVYMIFSLGLVALYFLARSAGTRHFMKLDLGEDPWFKKGYANQSLFHLALFSSLILFLFMHALIPWARQLDTLVLGTLAMLVFLLLALRFGNRPISLPERCVVYVAVGMLLMSNLQVDIQSAPAYIVNISNLLPILGVLMGGSFIVAMLLKSSSGFQLNNLDLLLISIIVLGLLIPDLPLSTGLKYLIMSIALCFYVIEYGISQFPNRALMIRISLFGLLLCSNVISLLSL